MWIDEEELEKLRVVYNREHPREAPIPKGKRVWEDIRKRLKDKCQSGRAECILATMLQKPKAPETWSLNRYEWLSSDDIDAVEKNYTKIFADYKYLGTVPIDFDLKSETGQCIVSSLCATKLKQLFDKGFHRIGIVFNTDPHDGPGEHWVAVFCDISPELEYPRVTYFDSYARSPEREIQTLMRRWKEQWDATGVHTKPMEMTYNKTRHQFKNSECGMYCLYFHWACLAQLSMKDDIPDDVINSFRNLLFRAPKIKTDD